MTTPSELTDKLDATTALVGEVSGPEDPASGWHQVDWRQAERQVRRLRGRIFTASKAGSSEVRRRPPKQWNASKCFRNWRGSPGARLSGIEKET